MLPLFPGERYCAVLEQTPETSSGAVLHDNTAIRDIRACSDEQNNVRMSQCSHDCAFVSEIDELLWIGVVQFEFLHGNSNQSPSSLVDDAISTFRDLPKNLQVTPIYGILSVEHARVLLSRLKSFLVSSNNNTISRRRRSILHLFYFLHCQLGSFFELFFQHCDSRSNSNDLFLFFLWFPE